MRDSVIDQQTINEIVSAVVVRLRTEGVSAPPTRPGRMLAGVYDRVEDAIAAAREAQPAWAATPRAVKERVIAALRDVMHAHAGEFARREWEETGLGRVEDKVVKVHNAARATPGLEDLEPRVWNGDKGLVVEEYAPYGVVAAVTPSTHPIPVLFNSLVIIIASGNTVVFNVHPAAKHASAYALDLFNRAIREHGGPENVATMAAEPTIEGAATLFRDSAVRLIVATGGPGLVRAAFAAGKKVIAAGPGNPPVLVDETADPDRAAKNIIDGAGFDNNILCVAEKEAFVVESAYGPFLEALARHGAVRLTREQVRTLAAKVFSTDDRGRVQTSREFIGKNASVLARAVGLTLPDSVRLLFGEADFDCPFVQEEQMMPYLPVVKVRDVEEGIACAFKAEHGYGHTAMIHSNNLDTITRYARTMNTSIVVVNGSSLVGLGGMAGEGTFSHTLSSPTGEGVCTPRHCARTRRLSFGGTLHIV